MAEHKRLQLALAAAKAAKEAAILEVETRHKDALIALDQQIESQEIVIQLYCEKNRDTLFQEKKSLDLVICEIGFELILPPSLLY